ncbi:hypothetical protein BJ165DRAFT_1405845 [Panaeolus papilionaceus]|nr:hypothetical protein BJ165DRAFT_1405845 [Panaeolus papilionaceus]
MSRGQRGTAENNEVHQGAPSRQNLNMQVDRDEGAAPLYGQNQDKGQSEDDEINDSESEDEDNSAFEGDRAELEDPADDGASLSGSPDSDSGSESDLDSIYNDF